MEVLQKMRDKFCDSRLIVWQIVLSLLATCNISRQHFSLARSSFQMNQSLLGEDQKKYFSESIFLAFPLLTCLNCLPGWEWLRWEHRLEVLSPHTLGHEVVEPLQVAPRPLPIQLQVVRAKTETKEPGQYKAIILDGYFKRPWGSLSSTVLITF